MLGTLMAAAGLGSFSAALYLASRKNILGLGNVIVYAGGALSGALLGLSISPNGTVAGCLLLVIGSSMILIMASSNTIIQTLVKHGMRGRVMSLYGAAFSGMVPVGSLIAGHAAEAIGIRASIAAGGLVILAAIVLFKRRLPELRREARPILVERGIIPVTEV